MNIPERQGSEPAKASSSESPKTCSQAPVTKPSDAAPVDSLSPEEQMALYEKELKENDWGHQPC